MGRPPVKGRVARYDLTAASTLLECAQVEQGYRLPQYRSRLWICRVLEDRSVIRRESNALDILQQDLCRGGSGQVDPTTRARGQWPLSAEARTLTTHAAARRRSAPRVALAGWQPKYHAIQYCSPRSRGAVHAQDGNHRVWRRNRRALCRLELSPDQRDERHASWRRVAPTTTGSLGARAGARGSSADSWDRSVANQRRGVAQGARGDQLCEDDPHRS